jgi:hypothetical protein
VAEVALEHQIGERHEPPRVWRPVSEHCDRLCRSACMYHRRGRDRHGGNRRLQARFLRVLIDFASPPGVFEVERQEGSAGGVVHVQMCRSPRLAIGAPNWRGRSRRAKSTARSARGQRRGVTQEKRYELDPMEWRAAGTHHTYVEAPAQHEHDLP